MSMFDRMGKVAQAEFNALLKKQPKTVAGDDVRPAAPAAHQRQPAIINVDVKSAWALLGLREGASLADVRQRYRELAHQTHPQTHSSDARTAQSAHVALMTLTEALETLEAHLLPLP